MRIFYPACLCIGIVLPGRAVYAADNLGDLDVTIQVIDSRQNINEFINRIELPKGIAETMPSADQLSKPIDKSSQAHPHPGNFSMDQRDSARNREGHPNDIDTDVQKNGRPDFQEESPGSDSSPVMDKPQRDITEMRDRPGSIRDQRDTIERQRPVDGSPNNWDRFRDSYPPSTWPERQK